MEKYSGETRVELTPLGWLYVANRSLRNSSKSRSKDTQAELTRRAKAALFSELRKIEVGEMLTELR
jgi:hypothetical protein